MKKSTTRILAILLAVVIFAGGIYWFQYRQDPAPEPESSTSSKEEAQPVAMSARPATPVKAMLVQPESLRDVISVNGSTAPNEEVTVASEVAGKVTNILFTEGRYVSRDKPLVQLDTNELAAQRERLLVQQELTGNIAERMKGLYEKEGVSLQEYEIARAEADQVTAELNLLKVQIDKRTVRAPFSGVSGLKQVSEGSYINAGDPIVDLVSTNPIKLDFSVPEKYSSAISVGTQVRFTLDGVDEEFKARVIARDPSIDPETRTLKIRAEAPNADGKILPGAFARVKVDLEEYEGAILVPTQAIVPELGGKTVFVYRGGVAQSVPIETGIRNQASIQVLEGLQPGDTVITTGVLQIRPGAEVEITELTTQPFSD